MKGGREWCRSGVSWISRQRTAGRFWRARRLLLLGVKRALYQINKMMTYDAALSKHMHEVCLYSCAIVQ